MNIQDKPYKDITAEHYKEMENILPPIYISAIDDVSVQEGFAVSEAVTHNDKGVVLGVYFKLGNHYYTCDANLKRGDKYIWNYNAAEFSEGNKAYSVIV